MACGKQILWVHNWGMVNSLVWYIISIVAAPYCLASRGEEGASTKRFMAVGVVCGVCRWLH